MRPVKNELGKTRGTGDSDERVLGAHACERCEIDHSWRECPPTYYNRRDILRLKDRVVDAVIVALQEFSTEELRAIAAENDYPESPGSRWLPEMVAGYLEMYR